MLLNGQSYSFLRRLNLLDEPSSNIKTDDKLELVRQKAQENIRKSYEKNSRTYNLRSRPVHFEVGQLVFRKNFAQSKAIYRPLQ